MCVRYGGDVLFTSLLCRSRAVLFGSVFVLFLLAGCGGGSSSGGDDTTVPITEQPGTNGDLFVGRFEWNTEDLAGTEDFPDASLTNFEPQTLSIVRNDSQQLTCIASTELLTADSGLEANFTRYVENSTTATFVSVSDISKETGPVKEAIIQAEQSNGLDVTTILNLYYLGEASTSFGIAAVFFIDCRSATTRFSENEVQMRRILGSVDFLRSSDIAADSDADLFKRLWHDNAGFASGH